MLTRDVDCLISENNCGEDEVEDRIGWGKVVEDSARSLWGSHKGRMKIFFTDKKVVCLDRGFCFMIEEYMKLAGAI